MEDTAEDNRADNILERKRRRWNTEDEAMSMLYLCTKLIQLEGLIRQYCFTMKIKYYVCMYQELPKQISSTIPNTFLHIKFNVKVILLLYIKKITVQTAFFKNISLLLCTTKLNLTFTGDYDTHDRMDDEPAEKRPRFFDQQ